MPKGLTPPRAVVAAAAKPGHSGMGYSGADISQGQGKKLEP